MAGLDALVDQENQDTVAKYPAVSKFRGSIHYTVIRPHPRSLASATARNIAVQVKDVSAYLEALEAMEAMGKKKDSMWPSLPIPPWAQAHCSVERMRRLLTLQTYSSTLMPQALEN